MCNLKFNKNDIWALSIIAVIFFIFAAIYGNHYINLLIDVGREVYYPELVLKGKLLYKDLFNLFGPLSYQLNAFIYYIFGIKISNLLLFSEICGFIITCLIYLLNRFFFDSKISFFITFFMMAISVFAKNVFNFIFPYSLALLYSYLTFLAAVLCFLYSFKFEQKRNLLLFLSYFFMGISIASKFEYLPFIFILAFYSLFVFKQKFKFLLINIVSLLFVSVLSWGILFIQGLTIADILNNLHYITAHVTSKSLEYFYKHSTGTYFSLSLFDEIKIKHIIILLTFVAIESTVYTLIHGKWIIKLFATVIVGLFFYTVLFVNYYFFFLPYFVYIYFFYHIFKNVKNKNFDLKNDIMFAFCLVTVVSILKTAFLINVNIYGTYSLLFPLIMLIYACSEEISKLFPKISADEIKGIFASILVVLSITLFTETFLIFVYKYDYIKSERGFVYDNDMLIHTTKHLIEYLEKNVSKDKSVLVIPEGVMINYITGYDMKLYNYYSLLPTFIDTFGIDKILDDIKSKKIDYIVINTRELKEYGGTAIDCDNYNYIFNEMTDNEKRICKFILENYEKQISFHSYIKYDVYKRR